MSAWDILSGDVQPGENVLIYDDAGDHPALMAAEVIAASGARVEIMTRDRSFAPEVMAMNLVPYMRSLQKTGAVFTVTRTLQAIEKSGNHLQAHIGTDYSDLVEKREYDQVVVNQGTLPLDDLYFDLIASVAQSWGGGSGCACLWHRRPVSATQSQCGI